MAHKMHIIETVDITAKRLSTGTEIKLTLLRVSLSEIQKEIVQLREAGFTQIKTASPGFDPQEFVAGANAAFEMVVQAFAQGDRETLQTLLSDGVYENFEKAIRSREEAGETLENTLVGIRSLDAIEAYMEGRIANVTLKIVSEQVNVTKNSDGEVVDGDPNNIGEITDIWTFARDTSTRDPNWELVATRSLD